MTSTSFTLHPNTAGEESMAVRCVMWETEALHTYIHTYRLQIHYSGPSRDSATRQLPRAIALLNSPQLSGPGRRYFMKLNTYTYIHTCSSTAFTLLTKHISTRPQREQLERRAAAGSTYGDTGSVISASGSSLSTWTRFCMGAMPSFIRRLLLIISLSWTILQTCRCL